jgi:hypothetical protein
LRSKIYVPAQDAEISCRFSYRLKIELPIWECRIRRGTTFSCGPPGAATRQILRGDRLRFPMIFVKVTG